MNAPVPIAMGPVPSSESSTAIPESSINLQIEESKKRKREKSYSKCNQCRTDKQKCVKDPDLPLNMCKRCHDKNLHCSGPVEMAKGRPRKSKHESQIDSLLGPALRSIRDYESKMAKLCDSEDIEEILQYDGELFGFLECIGNLRRRTHDTILNTIDPGTTSQRRNPSFADSGLRQLLLLQNLALQSDGLVDCSLKWREYRRELAERCSRPEHIGESYTLQLEVCSTSSDKSDWEKLFDLRDQFQERLLLIFDPLEEEFWISPMLFPSPLPFPSPLIFPEVFRSTTAEKIWQRRDCLGSTLLHAILNTTDYWSPSWQSSLVEMLDSAPKDIDTKDVLGRTVLYTACEHGRYKAVVELLARKADPQLPTSLDLTPLHIAAASGHTSICNLLLRHGQCDIDSRDVLNGWTPLCYASRHGHYDVVQLLLDHKGVDVNHRGIFKRTPLHLAVEGCHLGVLKLLGGHDEVVHDPRDDIGWSTLHFAVDDKFVDGLNYLLEVLQLDPNCKTDDGTTPLMLAAIKDTTEIVRLLVKDSRTWLLTRNDDGESAFNLDALPEICDMLDATLEARWGGDRDIVAENVLKWPAIRASAVSFGQSRSDVSLSFDDLHSDFMQSLMRFFEGKGVLGWANANAEHWASARLLFEGEMVAGLQINGL